MSEDLVSKILKSIPEDLLVEYLYYRSLYVSANTLLDEEVIDKTENTVIKNVRDRMKMRHDEIRGRIKDKILDAIFDLVVEKYKEVRG